MKPALVLVFILFGCGGKSPENAAAIGEAKPHSIRDSVFYTVDIGYGYDIIVDGKVQIHQPHIPVVASNLGFTSAIDAGIVAQLVIAKLKQNQFPPGISQEELKQFGIVQ